MQCQCCATQKYWIKANWLPMNHFGVNGMPMPRQVAEETEPEMNQSSVNAMPMLCHSGILNNFFQQSVTVPHECHWVTGLPLTVWRIFKSDPLAEIQDRKGTPFENFWRASRPIRSQDSELSTNQRPRFQGNSWHQPNFYCVPGVPLNQFPSNILPNMPMKCKFVNDMRLEPLSSI